MAERRMFSMKIVDTDAFLEMPATSQNLYFHFGMRADDDGFVAAPRKIMKMVSCSEDDFKLLIAKKFIICFESGVCVIKHWKINNYIQKDRYSPTTYIDEKTNLRLKDNGSYTTCIHDVYSNVYSLDAQVSIGKDSIGKSKESKDMRARALRGLLDNSDLSEKLKISLNEWLVYKKYNYQIEGFKKLIIITQKKLDLFSEIDICNLIDECIANTWKGIIWDKLKTSQKSEIKKGDGSKYADLK